VCFSFGNGGVARRLPHSFIHLYGVIDTMSFLSTLNYLQITMKLPQPPSLPENNHVHIPHTLPYLRPLLPHLQRHLPIHA